MGHTVHAEKFPGNARRLPHLSPKASAVSERTRLFDQASPMPLRGDVSAVPPLSSAGLCVTLYPGKGRNLRA